MRYLYLAIGWGFVGLGFIGAFLPVLPTTPFLLIAAWAFSKSSERMHRWLYTHPTFGPYLLVWRDHRAIPTSAKTLAVTMMTAGWVFVLFTSDRWEVPVFLGLTHLCVGAYIVTRPSGPPLDSLKARVIDAGL